MVRLHPHLSRSPKTKLPHPNNVVSINIWQHPSEQRPDQSPATLIMMFLGTIDCWQLMHPRHKSPSVGFSPQHIPLSPTQSAPYLTILSLFILLSKNVINSRSRHHSLKWSSKQIAYGGQSRIMHEWPKIYSIKLKFLHKLLQMHLLWLSWKKKQFCLKNDRGFNSPLLGNAYSSELWLISR